MFTWLHEYSIEVDIPIHAVWDFFANPRNWTEWLDEFDSFHSEGDLKTNSTINGKVKGRNIYIPFLITEVIPNASVGMMIKTLLFTQKSTGLCQEISSTKTRITVNTSVTSLLTPFLKSYYSKTV
jgi:hypothetical protein